MSIFLKPGQMKVKDENGDYTGINVLAEESAAEYMEAMETKAGELEDAIEAKGEETLESIPDDYSELSDAVDELNERLVDARLKNYSVKDNYYISTIDYEETANSSYSCFTVSVAPYKNLHIRTHAYKTAGICFFKENGEPNGYIYPTGTENTYLFDELVTLPEGTATVKISCLKAQKSDFSVKTTLLEFYTGLAQAVDSITPSADYSKTKTAFDDLCANGETLLTSINWEVGTINGDTGATIASTKYLRTADYIEVGYKKIIILNPDTGYRIYPLWFDSDYSVITPASYKVQFVDRTEMDLPDNVAYIKLLISKTDASVITVDEASHAIITYKTTLQRDINLAVGDDELPEYYKTDDYIYNKIDRINELYNLYAADGTAFVFVTDEHYEHPRFNAQNSPKLINYIYRHTNIETLVDGGDMCDGVSSLWCEQLKQSWGGRIYHVIGNHDYMYATQAREQELYAMCDAVNRDQIGVNNRHYYYVDNPQEKIRFIVLSTYAPSGSTSSVVANAGYESDQLTWLLNTALNVESGWGIVVFVHGLYEWNAGESGMGEGYYISHGEGGQEVVSILENYSGNGEIISVISGHSHLDRVIYSSNANICYISTTCDANTVSRFVTADPRTTGTTGEQAIDVFILDRPNRTWHIVRIGTPAYDGIGATPGNPVGERTITY